MLSVKEKIHAIQWIVLSIFGITRARTINTLRTIQVDDASILSTVHIFVKEKNDALAFLLTYVALSWRQRPTEVRARSI